MRSTSFEELAASYFGSLDRGDREAAERVLASRPEWAIELQQRAAAMRSFGMLRHPPPRLNARLGEFVLAERIGAGGMGEVYRAWQEPQLREVAIKVLRPEFGAVRGLRDRFHREIEAVGRVRHPGVVTIHSVGEHEGVLYFAMELVRGRSLEQVIEGVGGRQPADLTAADLLPAREGTESAGTWVEAWVRVCRQVAEALQACHDQGIHHRDVKPSNVLVADDGRVVLIDFGLCRDAAAARITRTGQLMGSLLYAPPERLRNSASRSAAAEDVYGLGLVLYEGLALRHPFGADDARAVQRRILDGRVEPLRAVNKSVAPGVDTVCRMAMEPNPARRYRSAAAFARDLQNLLELRPITARPPSVARRSWCRVRAHPVLATATVVLLLAA